MKAFHRSVPSLVLALAVAGCSDGSGSDEPISEGFSPPISSNPNFGSEAAPPEFNAGSTAVFGGTSFGGLSGTGPDAGPPVRLGALRTAAKSPPPISGGTLAVDKAGTVAVIADSDRDLIYVVDLVTGGVRKVELPSGSEPGRLALDAEQGAHVALRGTGKLVRIDLASASVAIETDVCPHPRGVAFDAAGGNVVVACLEGKLVTLQAATHGEVERKVDLPDDLRDVLVGANGVEALTRYRSAELVSLNADHSVKARLSARAGKRFSKRPPSPASLQDGGVFNGMLTLSPALGWRTLRSTSGKLWMLHQQSQDDEVATTEGGGYGSGGCSTITGGAVTEFGEGAGAPTRSMTLQLLGLSVDAALSPNEKWFAVASPGAYLRSQGSLQVYATSGMLAEDFPGNCVPPSHTGGDENQTVAVAFDDKNVLYAYSREPAELQIFAEPAPGVAPSIPLPPGIMFAGTGNSVRLTRKATIALDLGSVRDTGHDLFHADVGQGIACASCHGEALDDGHVWTFEKIGPRRTQNMRGGLLGTAPFHWDGDMMSINHLVDEVMTRRMGGFRVEGSFATALGAWIDRQPALTLPAADAAAATRGKTLFDSDQTLCSTCHSGKSFTNNKSADVGTGGSFQVPSLLGLSLRAPYMHNGCAKTLEARFEPVCGGGDKHGKTSKLTKSQQADLIAYLKSL